MITKWWKKPKIDGLDIFFFKFISLLWFWNFITKQKVFFHFKIIFSLIRWIGWHNKFCGSFNWFFKLQLICTARRYGSSLTSQSWNHVASSGREGGPDKSTTHRESEDHTQRNSSTASRIALPTSEVESGKLAHRGKNGIFRGDVLK